MRKMTAIFVLVFATSTVFAAAASNMQSIVERSYKIKAVVSALKQQSHCSILNYEQKTSADGSGAEEFKISYICNNNRTTEDQQIIDIAGRVFLSGKTNVVLISEATTKDAPTVGE